jgi:hypothetical protein
MQTIQTVKRRPTISNESASKARQQHYYVKADGSGKLKLSGAERMFEKNPSIVYVPLLNVVGTVDDIISLLAESGYDRGDVDRLIASAYTASNYKGQLKAQYDDEVDKAKVYGHQSTIAKNNTPYKYTLSQPLLDGLYNDMKTATGAVAKTAGTSGTAATGAGRKGKTKSLGERMQGLKQGQFMDVSNYVRGGPKGQGIKPMDSASKRGVQRTKKIELEGFATASDNEDALRRFWNDLDASQTERAVALFNQKLRARQVVPVTQQPVQQQFVQQQFAPQQQYVQQQYAPAYPVQTGFPAGSGNIPPRVGSPTQVPFNRLGGF